MKKGKFVLFYLTFALVFLLYLLAGWLTDAISLSPTAAILAVALILGNIYFYFKEKKKKSKKESVE